MKLSLSISDRLSNLILFSTGIINICVGIGLIIMGLQKPVDLLLCFLNILSLMILCLVVLVDFIKNKVFIIGLFAVGFLFSFVIIWFLMETPSLVAGTFLIAVSGVLVLRSLMSRVQVQDTGA
jgi:hypothetical protein